MTKLKTNEEFRLKGERSKPMCKQPLNWRTTHAAWKALRDWLSNDLESTSPQLAAQVERMGLWLGQSWRKTKSCARRLTTTCKRWQ